MSVKVSEKLESHRLCYHKEHGKIPLFLYEDLSPEDLQFISRLVLAKMAKSQERDRYEIMVDVLREWGIMCPHPLHRRVYGKVMLEIPSADHRWFRCGSCDSYVRNEYWKPELPNLAAKKA